LESFELDTLLPVSRTPKSKEQKAKETEEVIAKNEREIKDDVRQLLRALSNRDQVLTAGRRAFQRLDHECKAAICYTLKRVAEKEKENNDIKSMVLEKFDRSVKDVQVEEDINQFVLKYQSEGGALMLSTQALTLLGDQVPVIRPLTPTLPANERESTSSRRGSSLFGSTSSDKRWGSKSSPTPPTPQQPPIVVVTVPPIPDNRSTNNKSIVNNDNQSWEFSAYLSLIFYASTSETGNDNSTTTITSLQEKDKLLKEAHRKTQMANNDLKLFDIATLSQQEIHNIETSQSLNEAVTWLSNATKTQKGRDEFVAELNQFRSRKVELSSGFDALGVVLWNTLTRCQTENDVRTAKVVMMLSQVRH
jgi:hypothetical protein